MTVDQILPLLVGPYGALVLSFVVIWGLWRLFRESQKEGREDRQAMLTLSRAVEDLTTEVRSWREASMRRAVRRQ